MRVEGSSNLGAWFQRVFPTTPPRQDHEMNQTCYRVRPPEKGAAAPPFAHWAYLERQNIQHAYIDEPLERARGRFTPMRPQECAEECRALKPEGNADAAKGVGLGGPALGCVPAPTSQAGQAPPAPAPQHVARLREPGFLGSIIDTVS